MSPPLTLPLALDTLLMKVIEVNGVVVPIRRALNFTGTVTWTDDPSNDSTDVALTGGGGSGATTLEASFSQPAVLSGTVNPLVLASGGYQVGEVVQIAGGGFYLVNAIPDGTHITLMNLGAAVNAIPGATVSSGVLIISSGPPNTLIQSNGAAITQRAILDLEGFVYADDAANNRMKFTSPTVITPTRLSTATTLTNQQTDVYGNTTSAAFTITMPPTPPDGIRIRFYDDHGQWSNHGQTIAANTGQTILDVQNPIPTFGASTTLIQQYSSVVFEFDGSLSKWHT